MYVLEVIHQLGKPFETTVSSLKHRMPLQGEEHELSSSTKTEHGASSRNLPVHTNRSFFKKTDASKYRDNILTFNTPVADIQKKPL
jgi:hypothetical protein